MSHSHILIRGTTKRVLPFLIVLGLFLPEISTGQTIQLKYSIGSGWEYSTDSLHFDGLGPSAANLRGEMFGDTAALAGLDSYVSQQAVSDVTAVAGVCLLVWSMYRAVITKQWDSTSQLLLFAGAPITLLSVGVRFGAAGDLKHAVEVFNTNHKPRGSPPSAALSPAIFRHGAVGLELNLRF